MKAEIIHYDGKIEAGVAFLDVGNQMIFQSSNGDRYQYRERLIGIPSDKSITGKFNAVMPFFDKYNFSTHTWDPYYGIKEVKVWQEG